MPERPGAVVDAKEEADRLDRVFHALAHSARRELLARLTEGDRTMGELAAPFGMSLPAVARHIQVLEDAGLVQRWREGRTKVCGLDPWPLVEVMQWVRCYEDFWQKRLVSLKLMFQAEGERALDAMQEEARATRRSIPRPGSDPPKGKKRAPGP